MKRLFWILQCGGWGIFFAGMFLAGIGQWPLGYTLVKKLSITLAGFLLTLLLRIPYRAIAARNTPLPLVALAGVTLSTLAAAGCVVFQNAVMALWTTGTLGHFPDFLNTIYYAFVLIAWSTLYFGVPPIVAQRADRERLLKVEALAQQAKLRALRLQLNPHFLFNTLNAISTLIAEQRNAEANRMLSRLSDFLRSTLDADGSSEISVADEIDFARRYLDIEKSRFGDRLHISIDVAPNSSAALVPPLILQPLVENAIKHAVVPAVGGGKVAIVASREDAWLTLGVEDSGSGVEASGLGPRAADGVGLSNVRQRLAEIYGDRSSLSFARNDHGGLSVSIRLPFQEPA